MVPDIVEQIQASDVTCSNSMDFYNVVQQIIY